MKPVPFFIVTLWMAAVLSACGDDIAPGNTPPGEARTIQAPVAEAQISQEAVRYEAVATINARTASTISAKLMGTVQRVHVQEGDAVKSGDLLVTIDPRTVAAQLDQAQAGLREAMRAQTSAVSARDAAAASADLAAATHQRYEQLLKEHSVSQQEFDEVQSRSRQARAALAQAEAMVEAARSRVQQARAALEQASLARKDAQVVAPYDGRVTAKLIEEGDLAAPGTPLLNIEQEGRFCADLVLPERHIQAVQIGQQVTVRVPALDELEVAGEVGRIVPAADARSRSFEVKVAMPPDLPLKSGMFARVFLPIGGAGLLMVPETAIVQQGQLTGLFVVGEEQIARFRLVRTGKSLGDRVEIISGLKAGQRYVRDVPVTLQDGMRVEEVR